MTLNAALKTISGDLISFHDEHPYLLHLLHVRQCPDLRSTFNSNTQIKIKFMQLDLFAGSKLETLHLIKTQNTLARCRELFLELLNVNLIFNAMRKVFTESELALFPGIIDLTSLSNFSAHFNVEVTQTLNDENRKQGSGNYLNPNFFQTKSNDTKLMRHERRF